MSRWRKAAGLATLPLIIVLLAGCGAAGKSVFPKSGAVAGWSQGESATLTGEGAAGLSADAAAGYAVESVERQAYVKTSGEQIDVQVWRMADAGEAYGLWSALRGGEPVDGIGNNADSDGARRLAFWQERYFVQALAGQDVPEVTLKIYKVEQWVDSRVVRSTGDFQRGEPEFRVRAFADNATPWGCSP